jgi:hypothetical protein
VYKRLDPKYRHFFDPRLNFEKMCIYLFFQNMNLTMRYDVVFIMMGLMIIWLGSKMKRRIPCSVIGITGRAGHGKDTVGNLIIQYFQGSDGQPFRKESFAEPLKNVCKVLFHLHETDVSTVVGKQSYVKQLQCTVRSMLQKIGTDLFRDKLGQVIPIFRDQSVWIWNMNERVQRTKENVVICDVRFRDEAEFVKKKNGILIRVVRSMSENLFCDEKKHVSEHFHEVYEDMVIINDGSFKDLQKQLFVLLEPENIRFILKRRKDVLG